MFKILVVEDNASNMKLTSFLLENAGYGVIKALDAESGITLALKEQPDLILMDVQLPGMDGLEATRILKSNANTKDIKIIAMTALVMTGDREKIIDAGCDGYVPKPIQYKEFLKLITDLLHSHA